VSLSLSLSLSIFCTSLPPIVSALLVLPLFGLGVQDVPFLPAVKAESPSQRIFLPTQPHRAHHWS